MAAELSGEALRMLMGCVVMVIKEYGLVEKDLMNLFVCFHMQVPDVSSLVDVIESSCGI